MRLEMNELVKSTKEVASWYYVLFWVASLIGVAAAAVFALRPAKTSLQLAAHLDTAGTVVGRVIDERGRSTEGARVWTVIKDTIGNQYSPTEVVASEGGAFRIDSLFQRIPYESASVVTVHAVLQDSSMGASSAGDRVLFARNARPSRLIKVELDKWLLSPVIFVASLIIAFVGPARKTKYTFCIFLSFVFTAAVLASLAFAMQHVHLHGEDTDQFMLGFATVSRAVQTGEWHVALTLPRVGFGAPIWVVLVAVSGAAILTVALILKEVGERPDFDKEDAVRNRIEGIVRHQFHILFAPLGAIFIYQLLSAAGAADNTTTVALAALGAGASLPALMTRAEKMALAVLEAEPK